MQLMVATIAGLAPLSLQDLTLSDLRGRSLQVASLLYHAHPVVPTKAEGPVRL